jgi:hypothetical protein
MNTYKAPSAFSNMNKFKVLDTDTTASYRAWKNPGKDPKKQELNTASFTEFPDLVKDTKKKTVFEGTSLASKLKESIAAEEEAAILKRLKKGDTPEMIFREGCVSLPLKHSKRTPTEPLEVPWWVTDTIEPTILPAFKHKTLAELAEERRWKRLGINPRETMLFDEASSQQLDDDRVSMPSETSSIVEEEENMELEQS